MKIGAGIVAGFLAITACALPQVPVATPAPAFGPPTVVTRVAPEYTDEARAAGLQGTVSLYMAVTPDGKASKIKVLHGLGMGLDAKAVQAVEQWEFKPGSRAGQPVEVGEGAEVVFRLDAAGPWRIRLAAYTVERDLKHHEVTEKPVLKQFSSPDPSACPAQGGQALINFQVETDGATSGFSVRTPGDPLGAAAIEAIRTWRYVPGTADQMPRKTQATVEFQCGDAVPQEPGIFRIGGGISQPAIVFKTNPEYAEKARRAKLSGTVTLAAVIDASGHAMQLVVVRSLGLGLDENAMEAVKRWRFRPGLKDGRPVGVRATIEVNFRLL